ncbi:MAG: sulfoxide reductase heme-binding subunit YedZ [Anaerolineae bacterium]|nr:sulfoxide reductase heme-binding subunit YedZ [Anaerolineae bacterium]
MVASVNINPKQRIRLLRIAVHVGAWIPLIILFLDWWYWRLVDPIREATLWTGKFGIILLVLSLSITPLNIVFGWKAILPLKRPLGLYAFMYLTIHFLLFVALDYGLNLPQIVEAVIEKQYALVGLIAFILLIPLAITSNRYSQRKLRKRWKKLHQLVYVIGILGVLHYLLLVKNDYTQPLIFATIIAVLLILRLKPVKTRVIRARRNIERRFA